MSFRFSRISGPFGERTITFAYRIPEPKLTVSVSMELDFEDGPLSEIIKHHTPLLVNELEGVLSVLRRDGVSVDD